MSKAMGLLPSWYWPEGVQRYLAAPQVSIYELAVGRWARRYGDTPALAGLDQVMTFRELEQATARAAAACTERIGAQEPRLALAVRSPRSFALLILSVLRANGSILLLDGEAPWEEQAAALATFQANALVTDAPTGLGEEAGVPTLAAEALLEADAAPSPAARADAGRPAIALVAEGGIVYHSHMSALSAAMAFAAFSLLEPETRMVVARPASSWEGLIGLLAPLQAGGAAVLSQSTASDEVADAITGTQADLLWIDEPTALALLEGGRALMEAVRQHCKATYVSVQRAFPKRLRRQLRRLLRTPVLTIYGYPATGAIAASHPSWYLNEAIGIPMTGVDLAPVQPETRQPVETAWEFLTHAGIGVRTRALAVEIAGAIGVPGFIEEGLWYSGDLGSMDANGMLYLLR